MSYVLISRGEVLFRRAQAIMYNKFSKLNELIQAQVDLSQAKLFKKNFDDAQVFNKLAKEGKDSELIYAPIFKDVEAENKKTDASKEDKKETEKEKEK